MTLPTVKVCNPAEPGGYMIVNESDVTPDMQMFDAPAKKEPEAKRAAGVDTKAAEPAKPAAASPKA